MRLICIDPGMRNTGIVVMDEEKVVSAQTVRFKEAIKGWSHKGQQELLHRLHDLKMAVMPYLLMDYEVCVCEGFFTYPGRQGAQTFEAAVATGDIISMLDPGRSVIQTSDQVFNPATPGSYPHAKALMQKGVELLPGDSQCTNDHERSAFIHGLYYLDNRRLLHGKD